MAYTTSKVIEKKILAEDIYKVALEDRQHSFVNPGQFAKLTIDDYVFTEPIPVCEYDGGRYCLVFSPNNDYETRILNNLEVGDTIEAETGLGNGFDISEIPDGALVVGGGMGVPPLLGLAKWMLLMGKDCKLILGFKSKSQIMMINAFRDFCSNIDIVTEDGSNGRKARASEIVRKNNYICSCGSLLMDKEIALKAGAGQFCVTDYVDLDNGPVYSKKSIESM